MLYCGLFLSFSVFQSFCLFFCSSVFFLSFCRFTYLFTVCPCFLYIYTIWSARAFILLGIPRWKKVIKKIFSYRFIRYWVSKKSCPFLYGNSVHENGQDVLDMQYVKVIIFRTKGFVTFIVIKWIKVDPKGA